ncbi:MAG TPA: hypothetical protein VMY78_14560 [Solirubrobacteraceae bacterium]|nr:hypothetical protein [Solirubrobacteraceae bacterium]
MSTGVRVAGFVALLAALFAVAVVAGREIDPETSPRADGATAGHEAAGEHARHGAPAGPAAGVSSSQDGLRLDTQDSRLPARRPSHFAFRIVDDRNHVVRDFQPEQGRRMHLIVVRRDLRHFQHLHPVQDASGGWSTPLRLPAPGVYRAYADFRSASTRMTLGIGVIAPGSFARQALPSPKATSTVDGYDVELREGKTGALQFTVSRDGTEVAGLQRHLGARGHLVVLRARDLAYEHVHPLGAASGSGRIAFSSATTEPGSYRLFLQFRHRDRVHTAAFTREVTP